MRQLGGVLPVDACTYRGDRWVSSFVVLLSVVATIRSVIHIARHDGGAASIAGINVDVDGGQNIVAIFAQWCLVQPLQASLGWVVVFRHRGLIPLILLVSLLGNVGRVVVGRAKPLQVANPPPGAQGSRIISPILLIALWRSLHQSES